MTTVKEEPNGLDLLEEAGTEAQKRSKLLYTRKFLLSLSELDVCKRLPSGFDQSLLSEFEDTSQDRFRISGGLPSQGYKRTEYGSSPPTRADSSSFSRGIHGRWDNRSSVKSDRESVSQSDMESDSGRRYSNQSRRALQVPEHDGLLGSGSFPRPPGFAVGSSTSKFRVNSDSYQPSRSNESYQPPRPYKAVPHSRRETNDSFNDETFGSSESTNEDREAEERKRRDSFELLRKEQKKAFQERQKLNPGKDNDEFMSSLMENSKGDKKVQGGSTVLDGPVSNNDSQKIVVSSAPASRPLVPPGFLTAAMDKSAATKVQVADELESSLSHNKGVNLLDGASHNQEKMLPLIPLNASEQQLHNVGTNVSICSSKSQKSVDLPLSVDASSKLIGKDAQIYGTPKVLEVSEIPKSSEIAGLSPEEILKGKFIRGTGPSASTSILEKLFGNALALDGGDSSSAIEQRDAKVDNTWTSSDGHSSKFAQWFLEEEKNQVDDVSSGGTNNLLSLIVGGEKGLPHASAGITAEPILPDLSIQNGTFDDRDRRSSSVLVTAAEMGKTKQFYNNNHNDNKLVAAPAVLTCEDLEQSILSEIPESGLSLSASEHGWNVADQKARQQKANVDDHAAQHLLSLLQKGTSLNGAVPSAFLGAKSVDSVQDIEEPSGGATNISMQSNAEHSSSGKHLTLETLFGTAFMKELQPVGVPTASEKGKAGITNVDGPVSEGVSYPEVDAGLLRSTSEVTSNFGGLASGVLPSNQWQQINSDRAEEHLIGFNSRKKADTAQIRSELVSRLGGLDASVSIGLPKEDKLISVSHPLHPPDHLHDRNVSNKVEVLATQETAADIAEKLAALSSPFRDERLIMGGQNGPPFGRSPYDMRELEVQYQNLRVQQSSRQVHPPQMNHAGSMFHQLDSHSPNISAQMKFMSSENISHRDDNLYHGHMLRPSFHQPSNIVAGLDPNPQNVLLQQMHMTGNFPPHMSRGFPRGASGAPYPNNHQMPGFTPDTNAMQGFPFGQRQPNLGALEIPPHGAGADSGSNRPEALQKLIEMELRSKAVKQMHPLSGEGGFGQELDMGFGYR